jgi:hypothetical protein
MESATLKSTTTDITVNRRRVINFPFHGLLFAGYCSQTEKTKDSHSSLALPKVYGQWVADEKLSLLFGLVEYPPLCRVMLRSAYWLRGIFFILVRG